MNNMDFDISSDSVDIDAFDLSSDGSSPSDLLSEDDGLYHASKLSEDNLERIDKLWSDDSSDSDAEPYIASEITAEEVEQIDEFVERSDVEPYRAHTLDLEGQDLDDVTDSLSSEDLFAQQIEAMSLDELREERERIERLSQMSDIDIFAEYDLQLKGATEGSASDMMDDPSGQELETLRDGLENKDHDLMESIKIDDTDDDDDTPRLQLKLRRQ